MVRFHAIGAGAFKAKKELTMRDRSLVRHANDILASFHRCIVWA